MPQKPPWIVKADWIDSRIGRSAYPRDDVAEPSVRRIGVDTRMPYGNDVYFGRFEWQFKTANTTRCQRLIHPALAET